MGPIRGGYSAGLQVHHDHQIKIRISKVGMGDSPNG
jgi:hypothetical protein